MFYNAASFAANNSLLPLQHRVFILENKLDSLDFKLAGKATLKNWNNIQPTHTRNICANPHNSELVSCLYPGRVVGDCSYNKQPLGTIMGTQGLF